MLRHGACNRCLFCAARQPVRLAFSTLQPVTTSPVSQQQRGSHLEPAVGCVGTHATRSTAAAAQSCSTSDRIEFAPGPFVTPSLAEAKPAARDRRKRCGDSAWVRIQRAIPQGTPPTHAERHESQPKATGGRKPAATGADMPDVPGDQSETARTGLVGDPAGVRRGCNGQWAAMPSWSAFHPVTAEWFRAVFEGPTQPQREGWPAIARGESTLILAPTGTGKTLTAFLWCLDRLMLQPRAFCCARHQS